METVRVQLFFGANRGKYDNTSGIPREGIVMNTQETDPVVEEAIEEMDTLIRETRGCKTRLFLVYFSSTRRK
jgi:uncharacterized membrane protein